MGDPAAALTSVTATLLASQLAILAVRILRSRRPREPLWLLALLACLLARLLLRGPLPVVLGLSVAAIWAAGGLLAEIAARPQAAVWHAACLAPALIIGAASWLGYGASVPVRALHAFSAALLACIAAPSLLRAWKRTRSVTLAASSICALLWAAFALSGAAFGDRSVAGSAIAAAAVAAAQCLLACSIGVLVLFEGYPWEDGLRGRSAEEGSRGRLLGAAYARLLETENALVLQDALITSGLLALGAAHEFKRSLSLLSAAAEHGLRSESAGEKQESLRLVIEQARSGSGAAVAFLERLSRTGREEERVVDAREALEDLLRASRAGARAEGVLIRAALAPGVRFHTRPSELGQIVFNLLDNAVQALRRGTGVCEGLIEVCAATDGGLALIEVRDNAGGVPPGDEARLFEMGCSSSGSTGIGLYLSRSLARRNGGELCHVPLEGGSCFRLSFPLADGEPPLA